MILLFLLLLTLYFVLQKKIEYWQTIYALGFKSMVPLKFFKNPSPYFWTSRLLFVGSLIAAVMAENLTGFISGPLIGAAYLLSGSIGRNNAYDAFRTTMKELVDPEESEEDNERYLAESKKTNAELQKQVEAAMAQG